MELFSEDTLHAVQLGPEEAIFYEEYVEKMFHAVLRASRESGPMKWKPTEAVDGVTISKGALDPQELLAQRSSRTAPTARYRRVSLNQTSDKGPLVKGFTKAVAKIRSSVSDVLSFLVTRDTEAYRQICRKLFDGFVDCKHLSSVFDKKAAGFPERHIAFKWLRLRPKLPINSVLGLDSTVSKDRDFILLEASGVKIAKSGRQVGYYIMQSIDCDNVRGPGSSEKLVRGYFDTFGFLFYQSPAEGVLDVVFISKVDLRAGWTGWIGNNYGSDWSLSILKKLRIVLEKHLQKSAQSYVPDLLWPPLRKRPSCAICLRNFGPLRLRHRCRFCGEVTCGHCTASRMVAIPALGLSKHKMCLRCILSGGDQDYAEKEPGRVSDSQAPPARRPSIGNKRKPSLIHLWSGEKSPVPLGRSEEQILSPRTMVTSEVRAGVGNVTLYTPKVTPATELSRALVTLQHLYIDDPLSTSILTSGSLKSETTSLISGPSLCQEDFDTEELYKLIPLSPEVELYSPPSEPMHASPSSNKPGIDSMSHNLRQPKPFERRAHRFPAAAQSA